MIAKEQLSRKALESKKFSVQCDACKKNTPFEKYITKNVVAVVDGVELRVMYIQCPKCGNKNIVQIKDDKLSRLLISYECYGKQLMIRNKQGKSVSPSALKQMQERKAAIDKMTLELKDKYADAVTAQLN